MIKKGWIGVLVLSLLVAGVLVAKSRMSRPPAPEASASGPTENRAEARVLLFADPREADRACGCGQVFRAVRAAHQRGVRTQEVDPERDPALARRYRVTVEPTVLVIDATGREVSRLEGESGETIAALQSDLARLPGDGP